MTVRAARGAIKVAQDTPSCVLDATERLVRAMLERNGASGEDLISMLFTVTDDIASVFPAEAARRMGLGLVPLMCAREIPVVGCDAVGGPGPDAPAHRTVARRDASPCTSTARRSLRDDLA